MDQTGYKNIIDGLDLNNEMTNFNLKCSQLLASPGCPQTSVYDLEQLIIY